METTNRHGILNEIPWGTDRKSMRHKTKSRRTKRMQRAAGAVSGVRGRRRVGIFADRQEMAEWAPLIRRPICGQRDGHLLVV